MADAASNQPMEDVATDTHPPEALKGRGVVLAIILLVLSLLWMFHAGIRAHGAQLGESVPVVPAVGALLILTLAGLALRRFGPRWQLSPGQVLYVYCFLTIAVTMNSVGVARMLFPQMTALFYFQSPENNFATLQQYIPHWLAPQSPQVITDMYEASVDGRVPWGEWVLPLAVWTVFLTAWFVCMMGIVTLFRKQWADKERLTFPIVHLALDMSDQMGQRVVGGFFRNPLMWTGFSLALLYNVLNILNAWNPAVPAMGKFYDIGALFTERPLSALRPLSIAWRPENIGLGYLVSTEITLSVWVFYLLMRLSNVFVTSMGYEVPGFPFEREQSSGAYLALGLFLIWVARDHLRQVFLKAFTGRSAIDEKDEPMSYRTAVFMAIGGFAAMMIIALQAGMWWWTAAIYFGLILIFALVYARARAEAGAAMVWLFPFYLHKQMMIYVGGSEMYARGGNWSNLTILSTMMFMSRGFFQSLMAYQLESTKIAQDAHLRQRTMAVWLIAAAVIGLVGAYYVHLIAYYADGANILEGGTTQGGYRVALARQEFEELSSFVQSHRQPDTNRTIAGASGMVIVLLLVLLRSYSLRFPFHPLGYAMVTSYGGPLWGPFFLVWIVKTIILRLGGMRMYRQLIPFFLGIVIGHFFTGGLVWGLLSIYNEMYRRYMIHFG